MSTQWQNHLTMDFSEYIPVIKWHMPVHMSAEYVPWYRIVVY